MVNDNPSSDANQTLPGESNFGAMVSALGGSVIAWSYLEKSVDLLLGPLLAIHGLRTTLSVDLVLSNVKLREKASIAVSLACEAKIPRSTLERTITLMNTVQNQLRTNRNRLFHDSWSYTDGIISRRKTTGSRIERPQARKVGLSIPAPNPAKLSDITQFTDTCLETGEMIIDLAEAVNELLPTSMIGQSEPQSRDRQTFWNRLRLYWR